MKEDPKWMTESDCWKQDVKLALLLSLNALSAVGFVVAVVEAGRRGMTMGGLISACRACLGLP